MACSIPAPLTGGLIFHRRRNPPELSLPPSRVGIGNSPNCLRSGPGGHRTPVPRLVCYADGTEKGPASNSTATGIQLYSQIERLITETAKQSQDGWGVSGDWSEIEGAWVLKPKKHKAKINSSFCWRYLRWSCISTNIPFFP